MSNGLTDHAKRATLKTSEWISQLRSGITRAGQRLILLLAVAGSILLSARGGIRACNMTVLVTIRAQRTACLDSTHP